MTELNKMVASNRRPLITSKLGWVYVHRVQKKMMLLLAVYFSSMNLESELARIKRIKVPGTDEVKEK